MAYQLDQKEFDDSYGVISKTANTDVIAAVNDLAAVLVPEAGSNALVDELIDACKGVQTVYNDEFLPSVKSLLDDFQAAFDIAEFIQKKATVGEVSKQSVGYKTDKIDPDSVII